jgi:hypothetical protein
LYAYGRGNPVNYVDPTGHVPMLLEDADLEQEGVLHWECMDDSSSDTLTGIVIVVGGSTELLKRAGLSGQVMLVIGADPGLYVTTGGLLNTKGRSLNLDIGLLFNSEDCLSIAGPGYGANYTARLPVAMTLGGSVGVDYSDQLNSKGQQVYIAYAGLNFLGGERTVGGTRSFTWLVVLVQESDVPVHVFPSRDYAPRGG